jgi:hypothetical protein
VLHRGKLWGVQRYSDKPVSSGCCGAWPNRLGTGPVKQKKIMPWSRCAAGCAESTACQSTTGAMARCLLGLARPVTATKIQAVCRRISLLRVSDL